MIRDVVEGLALAADRVLADTIEHDDCVVHRIADDGQDRSDEQRVQLDPEEAPENREDAEHDQCNVDECEYRTNAIAPGVGDVAKCPPQIQEDAAQAARTASAALRTISLAIIGETWSKLSTLMGPKRWTSPSRDADVRRQPLSHRSPGVDLTGQRRMFGRCKSRRPSAGLSPRHVRAPRTPAAASPCSTSRSKRNTMIDPLVKSMPGRMPPGKH